MRIYATQYLRPNRERREIWIDLPDDPELDAKHKELIQCGANLTAELVPPGMVAFTIEGRGFDFDGEVTLNGPDTAAAVTSLIKRFDADLFLEAKEAFRADQVDP